MSADTDGVGPITIAEVGRGDPLYRGARWLRYEVLRAPLGMPLGSEENAREAECRHWVAASGEEVVGCVLWLPEGGPGEGRLLQMAVTPRLQGTGLGRRLVETLERAVGEAGHPVITLHARDLAVGFYERLGYAVVGEPFTEVGIAHRHMRKVLAARDVAASDRQGD